MKKETTQNVFRENNYGIAVCGVDEIKTTKLNPSKHEFPVDPVIFVV